MALKKKPMRYAHSDGHTDLCYDDSGRYILTCGLDGDVRVWDGVEDDDAVSHRAGDKVYAVAFRKGRIFTASDSNFVQAFTFPDGSSDGIVTRFVSPVSHMCLSQSGKTLVAGSSDFSIKIVDVDSYNFKVLHGHEAPILGVALHPEEDVVASSSCDGTVRVWKVDTQTVQHTWKVLPKSNDTSLSKTLCRICWEPKTGKHLLVPVDKEIHIYERDSWKKVNSLSDSSIKEIVSIVTFSPCGKYVAASCIDGTILIWDWKTKKSISRTKHDKNLKITALAWNPKGNNELAFCDDQGQLGLVENAVTMENNDADGAGLDPADGVFDDGDDDFLLQATGDDGLPGGDNPDSDADDDDPFDLAGKESTGLDDLQSNGDAKSDIFDLDDAKSTTSEAPKQAPPRGAQSTPLQKPFQSGSTPEHLTARFMKWNSIGIVRQYTSEDENSIDVEFHDSSVHHAMHFINDSGYTMADISTQAVILAAEADDSSASKLFCMHFASWDNSKDWSMNLPEGENIEAVCLGDGWVAIATDLRNIRVMSVGGVQRDVFSIPGPVVCIAGQGEQLIVAFHSGSGIPGDQNLSCILLNLGARRKSLLNGQSLPLSPKATLNWFGFTAEGTPALADSRGAVRLLNRCLGNTWSEICNTNNHARGKSDHYWIVGIHENPQQLRCIMCKGSKFPATLPRPVVSILPFQIPLCELNSEKSQYEEIFIRSRLFSGHLDLLAAQGYDIDEVKADLMKPTQEALMKLFALSARSDRECRAVEVCEMMPDEHTLQLAIKYASRLRRIQLAEKISELARRRAEEEETVEEVEEEEYIPRIPQSRQNGLNRRHEERKQNLIGDGDPDVETENGENCEEEMDQEVEEEITGPQLKITSKTNIEDKSSEPKTLSFQRKNPFKVGSPHKTNTVLKGSKVFDEMAPKEKKISKTSIFPTQPAKKKKEKIDNAVTNEEKKRKRSNENSQSLLETTQKKIKKTDSEQNDKKITSTSGISKLANFAFSKND